MRNSSQGVFVPPGIVKICTFFASVLLLQSCTPQLSWKESYLHRQWERAFLTAQSQYQDGNYKDAGKSYLEAITYANQMESDANKDAAVKTGLANCYFKLNAAKKAEGRFGEAIAILRQHLKQTLTPSERRISTENLEHTLLEQGKFHYAQEEYKKADAEFSEARKLLDGLSVGNRDIEAEYTESRERAILLAYTFNNQQKLGQYSDAQNTADLILSEKLRYAIPAKLLEDIEKKAVNSLNNNGKKEEAEKLQVMDIWLKETLDGQESLKNHDYAEAEKHHKKALQIALNDHKTDWIINSYDSLCTAYSFEGKWAEIKELRRRSLAEYDKKAEANPHQLEKILARLVRSNPFGPLDSIEPEMKRWLKVSREISEENPLKLATCLLMVAGIYDRNGLENKAVPLIQESYALLKNAEGGRNEADAAILWLADELFYIGDFAKAREIYKTASNFRCKSQSEIIRKIYVDFLRSDIEFLLGNEKESKSLWQSASEDLKGQGNNSSTLQVAKQISYRLASLQRHKQAKAATRLADYLNKLSISPASADESSIDAESREVLASVLAAQKQNSVSKHELICGIERLKRIESRN